MLVPPPPLPYLVAIITEKANLVKARDAKARVLVRPTKGGMLVQEDGKADPHKIAALPKMKMVVRFLIFCPLYIRPFHCSRNIL